MRKIIVAAFVSIDGVMQAPGGPEEDTSGGFAHGGWLVPHFDAESGAAVGELLGSQFDLLLGRKTYDIFAGYWPRVPKDPNEKGYDPGNAQIGTQFDRVTKYVATHRPESLAWQNSKALGTDIVSALRALKKSDGPDLVTQGSSDLLHQLFQHDLVDELRLLTFPVVLGKGKRLFDTSSAPKSLRHLKTVTSTNGIVIASYARGGEVKTGSFAFDDESRQKIG